MGQALSYIFYAHGILSIHKLYIEGDRYDEYDDYPIDKFRSLIGVTVGWTLLHYSFLFRESATAFSVLAQLRKAGEKIGINAIKYGSAGGSVMLNAVRTSGNMVEQSPAFLILLWLHGIFISPSSASWHGWLWLFFRSIYPQVFGTIPYIFFSTFPGYFIIASLTWPLARLTYKTDSD